MPATMELAYYEGLLYTPTALVKMAAEGKLSKMVDNPAMHGCFCGAGPETLYLEEANFADTEELSAVYLVARDEEDPTGLRLEAHVWGLADLAGGNPTDDPAWYASATGSGEVSDWDQF